MSIVIDPWFVSPLLSIENLPSTLFVTLVPNRCLATSARVPSDAAIACISTCAAAAAYGGVRVDRVGMVRVGEVR